MSFTDAGPSGPDQFEISGYVDIQCGNMRIQADTVRYDTVRKQGVAEGVVVLDWDENRITGSRLEFDLVNRTGSMTDATGWVEPEAILQAKTIRKLDEDHVLLESGTFTACTQPIPYWSFRVGRGMFHLKHYAHLRHVRMNIGRVPVFYLPWMLWPIKGDRATGLLFPQWGTSRRFGFFAGEAFFWAFADNADLTLYGDYYKLAGPAAGVELNWLPTERGRIRLTSYYLKDTQRGERRYMGRLQFQQPLTRGLKLTGDLNDVSDERYYQDFERTLTAASSTVVLSTVNLVRNGEYTSFNVRAQRRQQFFFAGSDPGVQDGGVAPRLRSTLVQETLPELELRGRSRRLPGSPLFFSFETSVNGFRCDTAIERPAGETPFCRDATWTRLDVAPLLTVPLRPFPWLSFEGRGLLRETYYTAVRDPATGSVDSKGRVDRLFYELEVESIGPVLYHVYPSSSAFSSSYKHVIEPRILYRFVPSIDEQDRVPILDDRDPVSGNVNIVNLSLRNRLFAKRPPRIGAQLEVKPRQGSDTGGTLPWSSFPVPVDAPPPPTPAPVTPERSEGAEGAPDPEDAPVSREISTDGAGSGEASGMASGAAAVEARPGHGAAEKAPPPPSQAGPNAAASLTDPGSGTTSPTPGASPASLETNPVEILNFEVSQNYSFGSPLTNRFRSKDVCSDGSRPPCPEGENPFEIADTSRYGPLSLSLHFNPELSVSVDVRSDYDLANKAFTSNSLSGWYRWKAGYVNTTYVRQNPAGAVNAQSSQVRLGSGAFFLNRKLTLDADLGYDLRQSNVLDRRARVGYYTQCCGFIVEYLQRDFVGTTRRDVRFVVDLKGIGKFLDPNVSFAK